MRIPVESIVEAAMMSLTPNRQDDEHDRDEYRAAQGPQGRDDLHNQQRRAVDRRSDCRKDDDYVENFK